MRSPLPVRTAKHNHRPDRFYSPAPAGLDPTFVIGERLQRRWYQRRLGKGEYIVAEADESDASFLYRRRLCPS